jgi:hypothetical protein
MPNTPAFSDCAYPEDCQCAARGYQHERDHCAVAAVIEAAKEIGLDTEALFGELPRDPE